MFPYPSGGGIHTGHVKGYVGTDVRSRMLNRQGYSVLHPMGYDSFGLPAENYALQQGVHPGESVANNIIRFREQLKRLGLGYDWDRELSTTDPEFIKWTQAGFLEMYDMGLVSEEEEPINWCGSCKTGLANEDLEEDGSCERCGSDVERKLMRQWSIHITEYADRLLEGMDELEWEPFLLEIQKNWIGRQEGWNIETTVARIDGGESLKIPIFTADPTELNRAAFIAISPEIAKSIQLAEYADDINAKELDSYVESVLYKRTLDRKPNTGVLISGLTATNPITGDELPVYVSEYVLPNSDNGVKFGDISNVNDVTFLSNMTGDIVEQQADVSDDYELELGIVLDLLRDRSVLSAETIYRLENWVFSRQRYWGEPIPLIHCDDCGVIPVPRSDLPVLLPEVDKYEPTGTGESPLANIDEWVNTECPSCEGPGKRETNTMPQWAGSSWYWHRYKDPHNANELVSPEADRYWGQVDMYVGGAEHAARHLIYGRFWNMILKDAGIVVDEEPFKKVQHVGLVLDEDGVKISKRIGNSVNIDELVSDYGADALRLGAMQMGEFSQNSKWHNREVMSAKRFLDRVYRLKDRVSTIEIKADQSDLVQMKTVIKRVTRDIERFKFNTATSAIREYANHLHKKETISPDQYELLLSLLQPFAPHITEHIALEYFDNVELYVNREWPNADEIQGVNDEKRELVVMRDGKKIGTVLIDTGIQDENEILDAIKDVDPSLYTDPEGLSRIIIPENGSVINYVSKK